MPTPPQSVNIVKEVSGTLNVSLVKVHKPRKRTIFAVLIIS